MTNSRELKRKFQRNLRETEDLQRLIDERKRRTMLACYSCDSRHPIGNLTLVQVYFHVPPRGCNEGDYWQRGEIRFICPRTDEHNRLLFDTDDVPWPERERYENDPQAQFLRNYGHLFAQRINYHKGEDHPQPAWVNNYYLDQNRKRFGLVPQRNQG